MNRYIFHYLILVSLGFATISSLIYLKKNKSLSIEGISSKKSYLTIMYGSTIGINLILFFLIFPFMTNFSTAYSSGGEGFETLFISVNIPCPGHAPLITNELKTINGVDGSEFLFPNKFSVHYDSDLTNPEEILSLVVFNEYPATVIELSDKNLNPQKLNFNIDTCTGCAGSCSSPGNICGGSCSNSECNLKE